MIDEAPQPPLNWKPTDRRYVCFIDIMGFKNMVATKQHSEIYKMMKNVVGFQKRNTSIEWNGKKSLVKTTTYSDSIVVYSFDDSADSFHAITCTVSGLVHDFLSEGIPFKGAISVGTMTCDTENSIYFGQPLIDSYYLQEELYFYGIVAHCSVEKEIDKSKDCIFFEPYCCPFKKGRADHLTIYPIYLADEKYKEKQEKLFSSVNKMKYYTSGHLRVYIDSTIRYLKAIESKLAR